jgi:hypothetical protein
LPGCTRKDFDSICIAPPYEDTALHQSPRVVPNATKEYPLHGTN